jgi:hypothetical protein
VRKGTLLDNLQQIRKIARLLMLAPIIWILFKFIMMAVHLANLSSTSAGNSSGFQTPSASTPDFFRTLVSMIDRWGHLYYFAGVAVIIWLVRRYALAAGPARKRQLMTLANDLGMRFTDEAPSPLTGPPYYCPFLPEGIRRARNIIQGEMGDLKVTMSDLTISRSDVLIISDDADGSQTETMRAMTEGLSTVLSKRSTIMSVSTIVLESRLHYKPLVIWPESVSNRVPLSMGLHNVDLESGDFNRAFFVASTDRKFAYDVVHPQVMELLMANRNWAVELDLNSLTVWMFRSLSPQEFRDGLSFAKSFWELFPEYLKQDLSNPGKVQ